MNKLKRVGGFFAVALTVAQACDICPGDDASNFDASNALNLNIPQPFNFIKTCGDFQAVGAFLLDETQCNVIQDMGSLCGCSTRSDTSCHLCGSREVDVPLAFKPSTVNISADELKLFDANLASVLQGVGLMPSCEIMEAYLYSIGQDDDKCSSFQNILESQCGCDGFEGDVTTNIDATAGTAPSTVTINSPCDPCNGEAVSNPNQAVDIASLAIGGGNWTCGMLEIFKGGVESDSNACELMTDNAFLCGCNNGVRNYLGADTIAKQAALAWLPRVSGLLSIIGSSLIIWDVTHRAQNLRHQILLGMSVGDIIGAVCYCLSTLPIMEVHPELGLPLAIYGAKGNEATCTAQGFFVQLGYIGIFFNLALSTYYLMTIKYGMTELRIKKYRYFFILPPILVGLVLAFAGIPFYDNIYLMCHVPPPYDVGFDDVQYTKASNWGPLIALSMVPICLVTAGGCLNMSLIYFHVRKEEKAAQRWMMNNDNSNGMSKQVFAQALLFTGSFLLCWILYFVANFGASSNLWYNYTFWVFLVILNPLMGLCNCLVYFRIKWSQMLKKWKDNFRQKLAKKNYQNETEATVAATALPSSMGKNKRDENQGQVDATALPSSH